MSNNSFIRFHNFIESTTEGNYKRGHEIFNQHDSLLHSGISDSELLTMYNFFHPFQTAFDTAYITWRSLRGKGTSGTQMLSDLLFELMSSRIRQWDIAIQQVHDQSTSSYQSIMPHRRKPFQNGSIEQRIGAVATLLKALENDTNLTTLKSLINLFHNQLIMARDKQVGGFGAIEVASTSLETTRIAASQAMFKNYGDLVSKFYLTPQAIGNYLPTELLQQKRQTRFTGQLNASSTNRIFKRKLDVQQQQLTLTNDGDNTLQFYFTNGLKASPNEQQEVQTLAPHAQKDISPNLAGYANDCRVLYVRNVDKGESRWTVTID